MYTTNLQTLPTGVGMVIDAAPKAVTGTQEHGDTHCRSLVQRVNTKLHMNTMCNGVFIK